LIGAFFAASEGLISSAMAGNALQKREKMNNVADQKIDTAEWATG
jgi:hypothetical protein